MLLASQASLPPNQRTVAWDNINQEVMNMYLHDNMLPVCYNCHSTGHYATVCPSKFQKVGYQNQWNKDTGNNNFRPQHNFRANTESYQRIPSSNGYNQQPLLSSNGYNQQVPCQRFNKGGFCAKPPCQYLHSCNKCGRNNHSGNRCNARTNTSFMP